MIEAFFSKYFDKPTGEAIQPKLEIKHPVIKEVYKKYGICTSRDGFYRVIDPEEWQEHYMPWFFQMRDEDGVFTGPELYPFLTTAFGWAYIFINEPGEDIVGYLDIFNNSHVSSDSQYFFDEVVLDPIYCKFSLNSDIYEELLPIKPPLTPDECFGFFPLISMGGDPVIENVQRVKLREHLYFLAQVSGLPEE